MDQVNRRITSYFIMFSLIIIIGVVYAILQANLQINGTAKISENQWNVHFENIIVNTDSVPIGTGDIGATIDPQNNCKVDFSVTLSLPGDFYEFTVDAKNSGTIDAMIGTLTKSLKVNNVETETVPEYLNYTVTYEDDTEILENHLLAKGTKETYKVKIEFKSDIDAEDLPDTTTLSMTVEPVYIQADSGAEMVQHSQILLDIISETAVMDNIASTYVTNENGVEFSDISSDTNGKGIYIRAGTENDTYPIYYYRGIVDNNLLFGGFCWKIVRTTATGGVKVIYNGTPKGTNNNECNNTKTDTHLGSSPYNINSNSLAYVGYMYGNDYITLQDTGTNWYYAPNVIYKNGIYTLTSKTINGNLYNVEIKNSINSSHLNYHHYTCGSETETTCTSVKYVHRINGPTAYYITLSNGKKVEDALNEMLTNSSNDNNSTIKNVIDDWYRTNLINYTNMLEDTIFCNEKSVHLLNGWNPNGGSAIFGLFFKNRLLEIQPPDLSCINKNDSFTVSESLGNGKLTYPIGLLTSDEATLAGMHDNLESDCYLYNEDFYWLMNPISYIPNDYSYANVAEISFDRQGRSETSQSQGKVRPVISLKNGTKIAGGDGTELNPYIVE